MASLDEFLSQTVSSLKNEIEKKTKLIEELEKRKSSDDANAKNLEMRIKQLETDKAILSEQLRSLEGEHSIVKERVSHLEEEVQELKREAGLPSTPATAGEAYIYLAALCDLVQAMMYRRVFDTRLPGMYKVKDIVHRLRKTGSKANRRWKELQKELNWDGDRHIEAIKHCKRIRNYYAHPTAAQLTRESLEKSIELLEQEESLESPLSLEVINDFKTMWEKLTE